MDIFRKKPFDLTLDYLSCLSPYKISQCIFICSSHSWLQLLLLMSLPGPTGLSHHLGESYLTFRNRSGTPATLFIENGWSAPEGEIFGLYIYTDIPQRVIQRNWQYRGSVKHLACPPDGAKQGLETIEMCSAVKLKVGQHVMQHYVLS